MSEEGYQDNEIQSKYMNQERIKELELIKAEVSNVRTKMEKNIGIKFYPRFIPYSTIRYDKSSFDTKFKEFLKIENCYNCINPRWEVFLMESAYSKITTYARDDYLFLILDFIKGRFEISKISQKFIEILSTNSKDLDVSGLLILQHHPEANSRILLCSFQEETKLKEIENVLLEYEKPGAKLLDLIY